MGKDRHKESKWNRKTYFTFRIPLVAKPGNQDLYLEAGDYSFPFSFTLPPNLPSSFEVWHGHIRYRITATIDVPWYGHQLWLNYLTGN